MPDPRSLRTLTAPLGAIGLWSALALGSTGCGADPYPGQADENTFRLALISEMNGFDPAKASEEIRTLCVQNTYDGLYEYAYLKRPYELIPCLASAMPEVSADGLVWKIPVKAGIRFVDDPCFTATGGAGRELVAADFVYSMLRLMDERTESPGTWVLDGHVVGLDEFHEASKAVAKDARRDRYSKEDGYPEVAGLLAPDDRTVVIRLKDPYPQLQWVLAMPYTCVVPHEAIAHYGKEFQNHAVGTGPYRVVEYKPTQRLVLERSPSYRDERFPSEATEFERSRGLLADAGKRLPLNDRVIATVMKEDQPRWLYFVSGFVDRISIPKDSFDSAIDAKTRELRPDLSERGVTMWKEPQLEVLYDAFNMNDPVVGKGEKGLAVRRAMSLATDYAWAAENLYNGRVEDMAGPIPRDCGEYDPAFVNPWKPGPGETREHVLERARKVLADAGLPGGAGVPDLVQDVPDSTTLDDHFLAWQRDLAAIGLHLKPYKTTWQGMSARVEKGQAQIWGQAWFGDYPDAQNFLQLFYGPNKSPGPNGGNYVNPAYDALYERTVAMQPGPERTEIYRKMQGMVVDDCAWIVRQRRIIFWLQQPWLHGYRPADLSSKYWKYCGIDSARRRKDLEAWNRRDPTVPIGVAGAFVLLLAGTVVAGRRANRGW